jgi:hypothetical protein
VLPRSPHLRLAAQPRQSTTAFTRCCRNLTPASPAQLSTLRESAMQRNNYALCTFQRGLRPLQHQPAPACLRQKLRPPPRAVQSVALGGSAAHHHRVPCLNRSHRLATTPRLSPSPSPVPVFGGSHDQLTVRSLAICITNAHSIHHRPTPDRSSVHRSDRVAITENGPHAPAFQVASYPALESSRSPSGTDTPTPP